MAPNLEDTDEGLGEVVECAAPHFHVLEVKHAPKKLHAQKCKDDDEEEEKEEQRGDGADRVEQGRHQVAQGCPVPGERRDTAPPFTMLQNSEQETDSRRLPASPALPSCHSQTTPWRQNSPAWPCSAIQELPALLTLQPSPGTRPVTPEAPPPTEVPPQPRDLEDAEEPDAAQDGDAQG